MINEKDISKWIKSHPLFSCAGMCKLIGADPGNFHRSLNAEIPSIKAEYMEPVVKILGDYGFKSDDKVKSGAGKVTPTRPDSKKNSTRKEAPLPAPAKIAPKQVKTEAVNSYLAKRMAQKLSTTKL